MIRTKPPVASSTTQPPQAASPRHRLESTRQHPGFAARAAREALYSHLEPEGFVQPTRSYSELEVARPSLPRRRLGPYPRLSQTPQVAWQAAAYASGLRDGQAARRGIEAIDVSAAPQYEPAPHAPTARPGVSQQNVALLGNALTLRLPDSAQYDLLATLDAQFDAIAANAADAQGRWLPGAHPTLWSARATEDARLEAALRDMATWHRSLFVRTPVRFDLAPQALLRCPISHKMLCDIAYPVVAYTGHVPEVYEAEDLLGWMRHSVASKSKDWTAIHPIDRTKLRLDMLWPVATGDASIGA